MTNPPSYAKTRSRGLPSHDRWLLSYADFVTLLLAVFIVLFASQRQHQGTIHTVSTAIHSGFEELQVGTSRAAQDTHSPNPGSSRNLAHVQPPAVLPPNAGELAEQLQDVLRDPISKHEVVVQTTGDGLTVRLQELGFFGSGDAALLPEAVEELKRTARVLERYQVELHVEGHSDDQPIHTAAFHSNWELSTARATSVVSLLVDQAAFPPNRIAVVGYGSYRPIAENTTEEGRRKNRRIDLVIVMPHNPQDAAK